MSFVKWYYLRRDNRFTMTMMTMRNQTAMGQVFTFVRMRQLNIAQVRILHRFSVQSCGPELPSHHHLDPRQGNLWSVCSS